MSPRRIARGLSCVAACATVIGLSPPVALAAGCPTTSSAYGQAIAGTPGLAAYWRLDEATGTTACDSAGKNPGTYRYAGNFTLGQPGALSGDTDAATAFDGVGGYVAVADAAVLDPTTALTLETWVKPTSVGSSQTVIRKDTQYLLRLNGPTIDFYLWKPGGSYVEVTSANVLAAGVWQHVAVTYDGTNVRLYYDGALVKTQAVTGTIATSANGLRLASSTGYDYYKGVLDEPAIYGTALSASQIASHYALGTAGAPTGLSLGTRIGQITLAWGPSSTTGVTGYNIYRRNSDGSWPATPYARVGAQTLTYTDTQVTTNTAYTYRVTAAFASAESAPSNLATILAGAPCGPLSSYGQTVAGTPGIVGYWRFGETIGTVACDTISTSNGVYRYTGHFSLGQAGAISGDADTAAAFDGTIGYVQAPDAPALDPTNALTLEAWIKPSTVAGSHTIVRKDGQFRLRTLYQTLDAFLYWNDGTLTELQGPSDLGANTYQYVVLTYDGATIRLYVNGGLVASQPASGTLATTTNPLNIGASTGYDYFAGTLDELAIYGTALSAGQITTRALAAPPSRTASGGAVPDPVPTPPTDLVRTSNDRGVLLRWAASVDNDLSGYRVYRQNADGTWPATPLATVDANTTQYTDTTVTNGTSYVYRVTAFDAAAQESGASDQVTAIPNPPYTNTGGDPVILAAGDIAGCDTSAQGDALTAALIAAQPGFVTPLGDNVYPSGTPDQYADCYDPTWGQFAARSMPIPGDHDYATPNASAYFNYFGASAGDPTKGYYSYNVGAWHVIALNSDCSAVGGCGPGSPEESWLAADLAGNTSACTLAEWHDPLFSSDVVHGDDHSQQYLWNDLYAAGATLVLSGSAHDYERFAPQTPSGVVDSQYGLREIVAGTGGRGHYGFGTPDANSQVRDSTSFGVLKLTLHAASYDWQFLPVAGATFTDAGTTSCHSAPPPAAVTLAFPSDGSSVAGPVALSASTSNEALDYVRYLVNGQSVGTATAAPYNMSWNSTTVPDGPATITAQAVLAGGGTSSSTVNVTVTN